MPMSTRSPRRCEEYRAVVEAGFILQIGCPDLGSCRHNQSRHLSDTEFRRIAQRIGRFADIVGREQVIAGSDCGFGTSATAPPIVAPSIVWAKFKALAEGARIASERLWRSERPLPEPADRSNLAQKTQPSVL